MRPDDNDDIASTSGKTPPPKTSYGLGWTKAARFMKRTSPDPQEEMRDMPASRSDTASTQIPQKKLGKKRARPVGPLGEANENTDNTQNFNLVLRRKPNDAGDGVAAGAILKNTENYVNVEESNAESADSDWGVYN